MELVFYNNSKMEVLIKISNVQYLVAPKSTITIENLLNSIDVKFVTSSNSYIHKSYGKVIGYHFNVESEYVISTTNECETVTLQVIGVDGDHYEYYLRVVPSINNSAIKLKGYKILDVLRIKDDVINDYYSKQERNRRNKNSRKRNSLIIDIILDILYSALPIVFFVYFFAHNHVQKSTMVIMIIVILLLVVIISELSHLFYDKVLKKHVDKIIKSEATTTKFDINSVFDESYIKFIVDDNERYQNIK